MRALEWTVWLPARFLAYVGRLIFETVVRVVAAGVALLLLVMAGFWLTSNA